MQSSFLMRLEIPHGWRYGLALGVLSGLAAFPVHAQASLDAWASPEQYVRYTTPAQCEQVALRLQAGYWRARRPDTVRYVPDRDSAVTIAVRAARACGGRFQVENVEEHELLALIQVYRWGKQRDLEHAAVARLLDIQARRSVAEQAWILSILVRKTLNPVPHKTAPPSDLPGALKYAAMLDRLGPEAAKARAISHKILAEYFLSINDLDRAAGEARASIAAVQQMRREDRIDFVNDMIYGYLYLAETKALRQDKAGALATLDSAETAFLPLWPPGSGSQMMLRELVKVPRRTYELLDTDAPKIIGNYWYNVAGDTTIFPRRGQVTLLVFSKHDCGSICYPSYATLKRMHLQYGADLQIVHVLQTRGYFRYLKPETPETEAGYAADYLLNFLQLPGVLAAEATMHSNKLDGRRVNEPVTNEKNYWRQRTSVLIGKDGKIKALIDIDPNTEAALRAAINSALR